jgi:hypothetical protein
VGRLGAPTAAAAPAGCSHTTFNVTAGKTYLFRIINAANLLYQVTADVIVSTSPTSNKAQLQRNAWLNEAHSSLSKQRSVISMLH